MTLIRTKNLTKIYGKNTSNPYTALKPTTIDINEGEFVCIMGPSGAGKSTLLNIIGTLDLPTEGKIFLDEKEVRVYGEEALGKYRNQYMGFIFQEYNLLEPLTNYENISIPLIVSKQSEQEKQEKIMKIARMCGIDQILQKYPSECSGGQKQRVAVCRGLVNDPKLVIADEPTGNLDSKNSLVVLEVFKKMNELGKSVVMVTHDTHIASHASRVLFVRDGEVVSDIRRGNKSQDEFFESILELTSDESLFFED